LAEQFDFNRRSLIQKGMLGSGLFLLGPALAACGSEGAKQSAAVSGLAPRIPEVELKIGVAAYIDVSWQVIGAEKNWFTDLGINLTPAPAGKMNNNAGQWGSTLIGKSVDVQVGSFTHWITAYPKAPDLRQLAWSDLFQGFALIVRPELEMKSYTEFVEEGKSPEEAIRLAVGQLRGKKFLTTPDNAIKAFVDLALSRADMTLEDMDVNELPDPQHVPLMLTGRADAQISGVPQRLTLEAKGVKPILTAGDLVKGARPSAQSEELLSVFRDGWTTTAGWYEGNEDTALRLTSVMFRIIDMIKKDPKAAAAVQRPFLNSGSGSSLSVDDIVRAYENLHPFYDFDEQNEWYSDKDSPLYWEYEVGAYVDLWTKKGTFKAGEVAPRDLALNPEIYAKLVDYRAKAEKLIASAEGKVAEGSEPAKVLAKAQEFQAQFNFLDAYRFAKVADEKA
jgi:ABC-type nitrate/sulfonate/bicarbonate transport system substrate-binding protein